MITLNHHQETLSGIVTLPYSKSIANRIIALNHLLKQDFALPKESINNDIFLMEKAIAQINKSKDIDCKDAGSVFRFALALAAADCNFEGNIYGEPRLMERPILPLIQLLTSLGASIEKKENGSQSYYAIKGNKLNGGAITLPALESSQFISALLLISPSLIHPLTLILDQKQGSMSYIEQTIVLMQKFGFDIELQKNKIKTNPKKIEYNSSNAMLEFDWSAASYFFSMALIKTPDNLTIKNLTFSDLQGDSKFIKKWVDLGVFNLIENEQGIVIKSTNIDLVPNKIDFSDSPDIALNFIIALALNKRTFTTQGLDSLDLKESKRLQILTKQLAKLGVIFSTKEKNMLLIDASKIAIVPSIFNAYNDHRLAMSFAQFGLKTSVIIEDEQVIKKSFPNYWNQLKNINFEIV